MRKRPRGLLPRKAAVSRIEEAGERVLSGGQDHTLRLWDVESGKELDSIVVDGNANSLAVHGDLVMVGNLDTTPTLCRWK